MDRRNLLKGVGAVSFAGLSMPQDAWAAVDAGASATTSRGAAREVLSLNKGWRFFEGDIAFPDIQGHGWTYGNAKAGAAQGGAAPSFDDSEWADVTLPHDFVISQPFDRTANVDQAYRRRGIVWYRTTLKIDPADHGKHVELQLDGIATYATVWFNGTLVCHNWSGYNSAYIDLTPYLTFGEAVNSLVIRVDAAAMQGWWYEGGGIYRNVWIVKRAPTHIITDGVFAHPVKGPDGWVIPAEVTLNTTAASDQAVVVTCEVWGEGSAPLARAEIQATVPSLNQAVARLRLACANPKLWSVDQPNLHRVVTRVTQGGQVLDEATTTCGFRTQRFDPDHGFFLNDAPLKIQGVCLHQDHAGVGVAVPASLIDFRLRKLKALGCNAIRCSHNAQDKAFMEACDRLGFLVMDENRVFNPSPDYLAQLTWLVRRDRNHPSVILWSVFNEEPMQGTEAGFEMVRRMRSAVRDLDPTRPVTAAMSDSYFAPINVSQTLDVMGFNYNQDKYDVFHRAHPDLPLISSEDTSAFMTRGEYQDDAARHIKASYDEDAADWGAPHRQAWKAIHERDFIAGGFVWTGFDYHGEPSPFEYPSNSSLFGILDLCGFEKTAFYIHQAQWVRDRPVLALLPHWNWAGREGQPIKIMACSNLEEVELLVNGQSIGRQKVDYYEMNHWEAPYKPGRLDLIGYSGGVAVAKTHVETAGPSYRLKVTADRPMMKGDGWDVQPFRIEAVDEQGRFMPLAEQRVTFELSYGGEIIGVGNGDPTSLEAEQGAQRSLFNGLAQVIVRAHEGAVGVLTLTARADGLQDGVAKVKVLAAAPAAYQATTPSLQVLEDWSIAPIAATKPDPTQQAAASDMNSWSGFQPGALFKPLDKAGFSLCAVRFTPFAKVRRSGGIIEFLSITGACEIYVDGQLCATKSDLGAAALRVALPTASGAHRLSVLFQTAPGQAYGFGGVVRVRA